MRSRLLSRLQTSVTVLPCHIDFVDPGPPPSGGSGTGRTTFVNTLVDQPLLTHRSSALLTDPTNPHSPLDPAAVRQVAEQAHVEQPIRIKPVTVELEEDGVRIALTIVDTPGFGDGVDNEYA